MGQLYKIYSSPKDVAATVGQLKELVEARGVAIFALIDHAKEAAHAALSLPDEQLLIFGDPKVGTLLMQENPLIGIELPLKILVWSSQGKTQVAFPNVGEWTMRFALSKDGVAILEKWSSFSRGLSRS